MVAAYMKTLTLSTGYSVSGMAAGKGKNPRLELHH